GRGKTQELAVRPEYFPFQTGFRDLARAENLKGTALQAKIGWLAVGEELVAILNRTFAVLMQIVLALRDSQRRLESVAAGPIAGPLNSPFERTDHSVVIHLGEAGFPVVHPAGVERTH